MSGNTQPAPETNWSEDKDARREMVFQLSSQRVSIRRMAQLLSVSPATISTDLKYLRGMVKERVTKYDPQEEAGMHLFHLEFLYNQAVKYMTTTTNLKEKRSWMEAALNARQKMIDLGFDTGLIPKAGQDVNHKIFMVPGGGGREIDIRAASPADLKLVLSRLMEGLAKKPELAPVLQKIVENKPQLRLVEQQTTELPPANEATPGPEEV